jgi:histidyl-tRNA synthetase
MEFLMKNNLIKPRLAKGFRDIFPENLKYRNEMIDKIKKVYEKFGYVQIETPSVEFIDVLGKNLPESDEASEGVFSFKTIDDENVALRYDLTAPLSRVVSMYNDLPTPFKRYQIGLVYRQEKKVAIGRYREFYQFDFDCYGSKSILSDFEICQVWCEVFKNLGFNKNDFIIKVNNRKLLSGILENIFSIITQDELILNMKKWHKAFYPKENIENIDFTSSEIKTKYEISILRCLDKLDKLGLDQIIELLKEGREDISGDFMPGCYLSDNQVDILKKFLSFKNLNRKEFLSKLNELSNNNNTFIEGLNELIELDLYLSNINLDENYIIFDSTVVRGLAYYTGIVFEAELLFEIKDEKGKIQKYGSVAGGGRYDELVSKFKNLKVPATGGSFGVDRLLNAYILKNNLNSKVNSDLIFVSVMDKTKIKEYQLLSNEIREKGYNVELYVGNQKNLTKQLKYASSKNAILALIAGSNEFENNQITIKDLILGEELSKNIENREEWLNNKEVQVTIDRSLMYDIIENIFKKYETK